MNITFISSIQALPEYKKNYSIIIDFLLSQGHAVNHLLSKTSETINNLSIKEKKEIIVGFFKNIRESDLVIAECSFPSINIGYEICHAIQFEKEVIILQSTDRNLPFVSNLLYTDNNSYIYSYTKNTLTSVLQEAIKYHKPKKYKKQDTIPDMVSQLNRILNNINKIT